MTGFGRLADLFDDARRLEGDAREEFLARVEEREPELREPLEELLAEDADPLHLTSLVSDAIKGLEPAEIKSVPIPPTISGYTIRRVLASGGMGVVYEAEQESPSRSVAIKVLRSEVSSESTRRRFDYESYLLANLRHPGIAQVYETGTEAGPQAAGMPFIVMELVVGARSITQFAREEGLEIRERIELFLTVCEAVQYAHHAGVIHRDLKPANILIDADGRAKLIDFGIARPADEQLGVTSNATWTGQVLGTPLYMSPEQVRSDSGPLDTRTDVYSLGVVLYELLCKRLPYDLDTQNAFQVAESICERPPLRPGALEGRLRGDLETIILKAIEKERGRRYQSCGELGEDLRRFLAGETVHARRPSVNYQMRVFTRRHKGLVAGLAAAAIAIALGMTGSVTGMNEARQQRDEALTAVEYLGDVLQLLDPNDARGRSMTLRGALDEVGARLDADEVFGEDSLAEAALRMRIGVIYTHLHWYDSTSADLKDAQRHLRRAFEIRRDVLSESDPELVATKAALALALQASGNDPSTQESTEEGVRLKEEGVRLQLEIIALFERSAIPASPEVAESYRQVASFWKLERFKWLTGERFQRYENAEEMMQVAIEMAREVSGSDSMDVAWCYNNLGLFAGRDGDEAAAIEWSQKSLEIRQRVDPLHPHVLYSLKNLAFLYAVFGDGLRAREFRLEHIRGIQQIFGHDSELVSTAMINAARRSKAGLKDPAASVEFWQAWLELFGTTEAAPDSAMKWRPTRLQELNCCAELGEALYLSGRIDDAQQVLVSALEKWELIDERNRWRTHSKATLAACYTTLGRYEEAEELLLTGHDEVREVLRVRPEKSVFNTLKRKVKTGLVRLYRAWDRPALAQEWMDSLVEGEWEIHRNSQEIYGNHTEGLSEHLIRSARFIKYELEDPAASVEFWQEWFELFGTTHTPPDSAVTWQPTQQKELECRAELGETFLLCSRIDEAHKMLVSALEEWELIDERDYRRLHTKAALGACYTTLGRFEEAEELLLASHQELPEVQRVDWGEAPPDLEKTVKNRLVELYRAWERPAQAQEWMDRVAEAHDSSD